MKLPKKTLQTLLVAGVAACLGAASPVGAQMIDASLESAERSALNSSAREAYDRAMQYFDRVNLEAGIEALAVAAEADEDHIAVQFLLARYARARAEWAYGEEALRHYDLAETALRRLLANPDLDPGDRSRVTRESERIREGKEALRARDEARMSSGMGVMTRVRRERLERTGIAQRQREAEGIDDAMRAAPELEDTRLTMDDIWPGLAAPGLAVDLSPPPPQQMGPGGMDMGFDPMMMEMFGMAPQAAPAQPRQPQPGRQPAAPPGGDPFGDPFGAAPPAGADPFAPAQPDPFGQPGGPAMGAGEDYMMYDPAMMGEVLR